MYGNVAQADSGAGIRVVSGAITTTHVTIADNDGGVAFSLPSSGVAARVYNSIIWGNEIGFGGSYTARACNIDQQGTVGTNIDPRFMNPGAGENYYLRADSPAGAQVPL